MKDELSAAEEADNSVLDELIGKAVLDHYADAVQPGQIHVESHVVLAEDRRGTETVTVYLLVLQEIYSTDGESLTLENGSYIPTAITFSLSTSSGADDRIHGSPATAAIPTTSAPNSRPPRQRKPCRTIRRTSTI